MNGSTRDRLMTALYLTIIVASTVVVTLTIICPLMHGK